MTLRKSVATMTIMVAVHVALGRVTAQDSGSAENKALGEFAEHGDVGDVRHAGSVLYHPEDRSYEISGSGTNMWFAEDQFHFAWRRMKGDFILRTRAKLVGKGVDPHRKLGWMIRSTLDTDSQYVDAAVHGDGLTSLQFRRRRGANTEELRSAVSRPDVIQLERTGGTYTMRVARFGDVLSSVTLTDVDLGNTVYVGLFVCAHNADVIENAVFRDVRIVVPAPAGFRPYRDYIGSRLEVLDIATGNREIVYTATDSVQAPNWTLDGSHLIYNRGGRLYRFDLQKREATLIDSGFATRNNNDHVLSFDGRALGISHHSREHGGRSIIYTMPTSGGTPSLVTANGPSYLHGWSPDGRFLVYTGERGGNFDIYRIPVSGGDEVRLTTDDALDDGSEYTPDGRHIYFNSSRGGRMELWRMKPDGSDEEQVTRDDLNNWFPHVSPDGRWIVFLSFSKEVDPTDHPFYRNVYLRKIPTGGGAATVIAYVYGGQGTINVPSWSPDGTRIAFVSNTGELPPAGKDDREP